MQIKLNGKETIIQENTIKQLLTRLSMLKPGVVVLVNDQVIKEENYDKIINANDSIEILSFVSGG